MSPVLAIGYIFNLLIVKGTFGLLGLILVLGISAGLYFLLAKNAGDSKKFTAQIVAISIGYIAGTIAVFNASWTNPGFNMATLILEPLVFFIFLGLGKR